MIETRYEDSILLNLLTMKWQIHHDIFLSLYPSMWTKQRPFQHRIDDGKFMFSTSRHTVVCRAAQEAGA